MDRLNIYESAEYFTLSMESQHNLPLLDGSQFRIHWCTCHSKNAINEFYESKQKAKSSNLGWIALFGLLPAAK
jgi:hypothetical protein